MLQIIPEKTNSGSKPVMPKKKLSTENPVGGRIERLVIVQPYWYSSMVHDASPI
jgi:hypothetical protein